MGRDFDLGENQSEFRTLSVGQLEAVVAHSTKLILFTDLDGNCEYVNGVWTKFTGLPCGMALGRGWQEFIHPDDLGSVLSHQPSEDGYSSGIEFRICRSFGEHHWVQGRRIYVRDVKPSFLWLIRDVTPTKSALSEASMFRSALDETAIVAFTDCRGAITHANSLFCEISGYGREELIGKNHRILNSGYHSKEFFDELWETISRGRIWRGEICNRRKDGSLYWVDTAIFPFKNVRGVIEQYLSIRYDITQRKAQEIQLIQSAKMASLGEMAGGIAHEINTPLAVIQGKANFLGRRLIQGRFTEKDALVELDKIQNTVNRIARIIQGLKIFSRDSTRDPMALTQFRGVIENALDLSREKLLAHSIQLILGDIPEVEIECRPSQLVQVLLNLLSNSFDAVENLPERWIKIEASIDVSVSSNAETDAEDRVPESWIRLNIVDSGHGIPPEMELKIMQPFFTSKPVGKGTGLGLSISKGIIEDHSGRLYYQPNLKNTQFTIELPFRQARSVTETFE